MLRIDEWAAGLTGMPDMWTGIQFDAAVTQFGTKIENLLEERDKDFKPVHTLDDLLADKKRAGGITPRDFALKMQAHGAMGRRKWVRPKPD